MNKTISHFNTEKYFKYPETSMDLGKPTQKASAHTLCSGGECYANSQRRVLAKGWEMGLVTEVANLDLHNLPRWLLGLALLSSKATMFV